MATILTKKSDTASAVPLAADLTNAAGGAELAVNATDKRLFSKTSGGTVVELGINPSSLTMPNGTANGVAYLNGSKVVTSSSALTFDGANFTQSANGGLNLTVRNVTSTSDAYVAVQNTLGSSFFGINATGPYIYTASNIPLQFIVNNAEQMRLTSTGLGIGTSSPASKLHVESTSAEAVRIGYSSTKTARLGVTSAGDLQVYAYDSAVGYKNILLAIDSTTSAGNVGIGTSSPGTKFEVKAGNGGQMALNNDGSQYTTALWQNNGTSKVEAYWDQTNTLFAIGPTAASSKLVFQTAGSERARITSGGELCIGRTSTVNGAKLMLAAPNSTTAIGADWADNVQLLQMRFDSQYFLGVGADAAGRTLSLNANSADNTAKITFSISGNGTLAERARMTYDGDLLVGWTGGIYNDPGASSVTGVSVRGSSGQQGFIVSTPASSGVYNWYSYKYGSGSTGYHFAFNHNSTSVGEIRTSTTATSYITSSDYRLKENIQPMTGALAKVAALKPRIYKWKVDGSDGQGFIAHELAEVVPDAVVGEKDALDEEGNPKYQGIDTSFLVATLTAAIQELKAEFDAYKASHP